MLKLGPYSFSSASLDTRTTTHIPAHSPEIPLRAQHPHMSPTRLAATAALHACELLPNWPAACDWPAYCETRGVEV